MYKTVRSNFRFITYIKLYKLKNKNIPNKFVLYLIKNQKYIISLKHLYSCQCLESKSKKPKKYLFFFHFFFQFY